VPARRPAVNVEAAINGSTRPRANPNVPRTPGPIATCALECLDRGAALVHNHNNEPNVGGPPRGIHRLSSPKAFDFESEDLVELAVVHSVNLHGGIWQWAPPNGCCPAVRLCA
jgi:beta-keto acid cleavage enzyme